WFRSKIAQKPIDVSRPLRFVQYEQQSFWGPSTMGDRQGTHVLGHWQVTNVSDRKVWLLQARLHGHPRPSFTQVMIQGKTGLHSKTTPVPAGHMATVVVSLNSFPPIASANEPIVTDIIFTDNFEEEHRVRARFRCVHAPLS